MSNLKRTNGITLVALVVTIVVLLILVGVSIAALTGNNGLLNKASESKEKTEKAFLTEKISLLSLELEIGKDNNENLSPQVLQEKLNEQGEDALVIKWNQFIIFDLKRNEEYRITSDGNIEYWGKNTIGSILKNTKTSNPDQLAEDNSTSNVIGISNNGSTINMCSWEYTILNDGTYILLSKNSLKAINEHRWNDIKNGYIGSFDENGKITEDFPAYISTDNGNTWISVTSISYTFPNMTQLTEIPELPNTLIDMSFAFTGSNIKKIGDIPKGVNNLDTAFFNCSELIEVLSIPDTVTNMRQTFRCCTKMKEIPELPESLINMDMICMSCTNLQTIKVIPSRVVSMVNAFNSCVSLNGTIDILSPNVERFTSAFWETKSNIVLKVLRNSITEKNINENINGRLEYSHISIEYF